MIDSTSESLLLQLQSRQTADSAWSRFVELYTPLIFFWARKCGLQPSDAADVVQDVLAVVFQKLPGWQYDRTRSFRGWLRTITLNRHRELYRKKRLPAFNATDSVLVNLVSEDEAASTWDLDYARRLVETALENHREEFKPETWAALMKWMKSQAPVSEIAETASVSVWTLYAAKSRLLSRLRHDLDGLLE